MLHVLALLSAVVYGAADFIGGLSARRAAAIPVVFFSQFAGLVLLAVALPFLPAASPVSRDWAWGAAAGLTGGLGVAFLYRGLAIGTMAVVAPITAVCAVVLPVLIAVALGERPGTQRSAGIVLAVIAIVMVTGRKTPKDSADPAGATDTGKSSVVFAFISGGFFGLFFFSLAQTASEAGLWPLLMARIVSVAFFGVAAIFARQSLYMPSRVVGTVIAGGVLDMLANLFYLIATKLGPLTEVVTLASLYPASTVLLARLVLHERLSLSQLAGVVCALVAVVMIVG